MYRQSPVAFCGEHDWLGSDVWYAHLVKVDADEIALLAQTGTGVAHCPQSNGRLGSGICPVREMADAGVPVSIGVDGAASNEAADMISEVHMTWLAQRARLGMMAQPTYRGGSFEGGANAASVADVIHWGTAGGAQIMGLDEVGQDCGGLSPRTSRCTGSTIRAISACTIRRSDPLPRADGLRWRRCFARAGGWSPTTRSTVSI